MTDTKVITKRSFIFTSEGYEELEKALLLFFGPATLYYVATPDQGFFVASSADGPSNIMMVEEVWMEPDSASLPKVTEIAIDWLESLNQEARERLSHQRRPHRNWEGNRLEGFEIHSLRNSTGECQMLYIKPGWV